MGESAPSGWVKKGFSSPSGPHRLLGLTNGTFAFTEQLHRPEVATLLRDEPINGYNAMESNSPFIYVATFLAKSQYFTQI
jgi:hypothetical protein